MAAFISRPEEHTEFETPERCAILEIWNSPEDGKVSIARARVKPGISTQPHSLTGITERYLILSGTGRVHIEGLDTQMVYPGDVVYIPPGAIQWIENTASETLVFYAICSPRFIPSAYQTHERAP